MLSRKLSTTVKTLSLRSDKKKILKACIIFNPATLWLPFLTRHVLQSSHLKTEGGGIRSSHKTKHLHSFLKVKDKVIFPWLRLKLWTSQPTVKMFVLTGFSSNRRGNILPQSTLNCPLKLCFPIKEGQSFSFYFLLHMPTKSVPWIGINLQLILTWALLLDSIA